MTQTTNRTSIAWMPWPVPRQSQLPRVPMERVIRAEAPEAIATAIVVAEVAGAALPEAVAIVEVTAVMVVATAAAAVVAAADGKNSTQYPVVSSLKGRSDAALFIWDCLEPIHLFRSWSAGRARPSRQVLEAGARGGIY